MTNQLSAISAFNHILLIQQSCPNPCVTVTVEPSELALAGPRPDQLNEAWWLICSFSSPHLANTFATYLHQQTSHPAKIYPAPDGSYNLHLNLNAAPTPPLTVIWTPASGPAGANAFRQLIAGLNVTLTQ